MRSLGVFDQNREMSIRGFFTAVDLLQPIHNRRKRGFGSNGAENRVKRYITSVSMSNHLKQKIKSP